MHTEFCWAASMPTGTATSARRVRRVRHPRSQRRVPAPDDAPPAVAAEALRGLVERRRHRLQRVAGADDERGVDRLLVGGLTLADLVGAVLVHPGDEKTGQS